MTTFSELINHVANDISFREEIEWTNTWIDKANTPPPIQQAIESCL